MEHELNNRGVWEPLSQAEVLPKTQHLLIIRNATTKSNAFRRIDFFKEAKEHAGMNVSFSLLRHTKAGDQSSPLPPGLEV